MIEASLWFLLRYSSFDELGKLQFLQCQTVGLRDKLYLPNTLHEKGGRHFAQLIDFSSTWYKTDNSSVPIEG